jgi:hypothetical protein
LLARLWLWSTWLAARRRARALPGDYRRLDFHTQTRGRGLRMTEWLRDQLRPGWLRLRHDEDDQ